VGPLMREMLHLQSQSFIYYLSPLLS
jgi:hypothetical protein